MMYKCINCEGEFEENTFTELHGNKVCSNVCKLEFQIKVEEEMAKHPELINNPEPIDNSLNNGGSTDYYRINHKWLMAQDIIEDRVMNYAQGNIFKAAFTFNTGRHQGTDYERELNKIIYFANRELERIRNEQ